MTGRSQLELCKEFLKLRVGVRNEEDDKRTSFVT